MAKSNFERLTWSDSTASEYKSSFVRHLDERFILSKKELSMVVECILFSTTSKKYKKDKPTWKVRISVDFGEKKGVKDTWIKLDNKTFKRLEDKLVSGANVDPSQICIYPVSDPDEVYGKEENDYTWWECVLTNKAILGKKKSESDNVLEDIEKKISIRDSNKRKSASFDDVPF